MSSKFEKLQKILKISAFFIMWKWNGTLFFFIIIVIFTGFLCFSPGSDPSIKFLWIFFPGHLTHSSCYEFPAFNLNFRSSPLNVLTEKCGWILCVKLISVSAVFSGSDPSIKFLWIFFPGHLTYSPCYGGPCNTKTNHGKSHKIFNCEFK